MFRKPLLLAAAFAAAVVAFGAAPVASAGVSCSTDTAAAVAAASVTYRGYGWSSAAQPDPLWTVDMPALNMTDDVYAVDEAGARAAAKAYLDQRQAADCSQAAPAPASGESGATSGSSAPSYDQATIDAATALAQSATVTYRGYGWSSASQPLPLWTVSVASLSLSDDVYAADEAGARQAALAAIEAAVGRAGSSTSGSSSPSASAPPTSSEPTATSTASPAPAPVAASSTSTVVSSATTSATTSISGGDLRSARQTPDAGSQNPLLAGVLRSAFGHPVTIQNSTVCVVGPRVVACSQVFVTLGSGSQIQVTISDGTATRIAVRHSR